MRWIFALIPCACLSCDNGPSPREEIIDSTGREPGSLTIDLDKWHDTFCRPTFEH